MESQSDSAKPATENRCHLTSTADQTLFASQKSTLPTAFWFLLHMDDFHLGGLHEESSDKARLPHSVPKAMHATHHQIQ